MDWILALKLVLFAVVAYPTYTLLRLYYLAWVSPLRLVPGPPMDHPIFGNAIKAMNSDDFEAHEQWVEEYGETVSIPSIFGVRNIISLNNIVPKLTRWP